MGYIPASNEYTNKAYLIRNMKKILKAKEDNYEEFTQFSRRIR